MRPALLALSIALATTALAQTPLPSHGPAKGYLVITGGATRSALPNSISVKSCLRLSSM
jgi:hypothetical protein